MRPINLIPTEERSGARKPMRGGPVAYIVLGALLAALAGVLLLVIADNQISDRKGEIAQLQTQTATAEAEAARLAPYTQFHEVRDQRTTTVSNLANSRFDWERVMQQLALVLPDDVRLTNLTGTVRPDVTIANGENIGLREAIPGPALTMVGCADGQEAVAHFIVALKDIEGVTRVGIQSSELPAGSDSGESVSASGGCQTTAHTAQFQLVVAFDAAPIPAAAGGATEVAVAPAPEEAPAESSEASTTPAEGG
jgi:Tfp pilus assembly protein PilN